MVGLFVRLKLRILRNRLGSSSALGIVGFILVWLTALGAAVGGGALMAVAGRLLDRSDVIPPLVFTGVSVGWVVGPLVAASFDDALDPRRFEALPIGRTQLGIGLAGAGLVGPGGVATAGGLMIGALVGFADLATAVPIAITVIIEVLLAGVTARFVLTWLSDLLRARRTREVMGVVIALAAAIPGVTSGLINTGVIDIEGDLAALVAPLQWFPPGALGGSVVALAAGDWSAALLGWAYGLAALGLAIWGYGWALDRLQVVADTAGAGRRAPRSGSALRPGWLPLPRGTIGAVAAKELAYFRRDPRVRGQLIGSLVGLAVIATLAMSAIRTEFGPYLSVPMAFFVVLALLVNQFGYDGGSFWVYLVASPSMTDVLKGKNLAGGLFAAVLAAASAGVGAIVSRSWAHVPAAVLAALAVIVIWSAVGNATSVVGPIRIPEKTVFASQGLSGSAFLASMIGLAAAGVLVLPIVAGIGLTAWRGGPAWGAFASVVALGYAVLVYRLSFKVNEPLLERNLAKVLDVIDKE